MDGILKRNFALTGEQQDRERNERLRSGSDAKEGIGSDGAIRGNICQSEPSDPLGSVFVNDRNRDSGSMRIFENFFELLAEFVDGLGRLRLVFSFSADADRNE